MSWAGRWRNVALAVVLGLAASLAIAVALSRTSVEPTYTIRFEMEQKLQYLVHYVEPRGVNASLEIIASPDCGEANTTTTITLPARPGATGVIELGENQLCNMLLVVEGFPLPYRELSVPDYGVLRYLYVYPHVRALVDLYLLVDTVIVHANTSTPLTVTIEWPGGVQERKTCTPPTCALEYHAPEPSKTFRAIVVEEGLLRKKLVYERGKLVEATLDPLLNPHLVLPPLLASLAYAAAAWYKQRKQQVM